MNIMDQIIDHFFISRGWEWHSLFGLLAVFGLFVGKKVTERLAAAVKASDEVPENHPFRPVTEAWQALFAVLLLTVILMLSATLLLQIGVNNPVMWTIVDAACLISILMPCHLYRIYERCRKADHGGHT